MSISERAFPRQSAVVVQLVSEQPPEASSASISFKSFQTGAVTTAPWEDAEAVAVCSPAPWRTFRWWYGQRHYSGTYWSATLRDHVIYESRLELARLVYADFDPRVTSIAAQPFMVEAEVEGKRRRHVPDYLLRTVDGPVVVDVKPLSRTTAPNVAHTLAWTRKLVEDLGWQYEVWTEPNPVELANKRFLAGYRNPRLINRRVIDDLQNSQLHGRSIGQVLEGRTDWSAPVVRAGVCHLLWRGTVQTDLDVPLQSTSMLRQGGSR